ncbi:MAG: SDR family oxidoreductase [Deltaproteobacteria bacterium]|nr:SDR family oxidoreductase [Deltaproteobacteria bacterium]
MLEGRVAVVTGAGVRLGRAIALGLGARGAKVVLHWATSREGAEEAAGQLRAAGGEAVTVQADLSQADQVPRVFEKAESLGGCDLLVNSAAIFERKAIEEIDDLAWRRMLDVNLSGPFYCCRAAVASMRRKGRGDIVNVADVGGGLRAWSHYSHYCAAKAGLAMLTRCLALELAPAIRVNAVAPGTVLFPEPYAQEEKARTIARIPLGREGTPEDVVKAIEYLLGAPYVTGQVLAVDGGRSSA